MRHLIAINCHPFHDQTRILPCLQSLSAATSVFERNVSGRVDVCVFWNGTAPPANLERALQSFGFRLVTRHHVSNGDNLNFQLDYAIEHGFDAFYRVDGDDTVTIARLTAQAHMLQNDVADIIGTGLTYNVPNGGEYDTFPPTCPGARDYLENRYILHPTFALNVACIRDTHLRYWSQRLEDKALILQARKLGLRVMNIPILGGNYHVDENARKRLSLKILGLKLNFSFLVHEKAWHLMPYAVFLFLLQVSLGSSKLRFLRHLKYNPVAGKTVQKKPTTNFSSLNRF